MEATPKVLGSKVPSAALGDRPLQVPQIVDRAYQNLDPWLKGAAALTTLAHLEELVARGDVAVLTDSTPQLTSVYRRL